MKALVCAILLSILTPTVTGLVFLETVSFIPAQSGTIWEVLDHDYISDDVSPHDVEFVNATHGWVLSQKEQGTRHGIILHTNDSGDTWYQQYYNASQSLRYFEVIAHQSFLHL